MLFALIRNHYFFYKQLKKSEYIFRSKDKYIIFVKVIYFIIFSFLILIRVNNYNGILNTSFDIIKLLSAFIIGYYMLVYIFSEFILTKTSLITLYRSVLLIDMTTIQFESKHLKINIKNGNSINVFFAYNRRNEIIAEIKRLQSNLDGEI